MVRVPGTPVPPPPPAPGTTIPNDADLERAAHDAVNPYRASRGLPPLAHDERIAAIAREHSEAMAARRRGFGHTGLDERAARLRSLLATRSMAENVAYDGGDRPEVAAGVVERWIRSPGHRENIVRDHDVTGVGVARGRDGLLYFTQVFVRLR